MSSHTTLRILVAQVVLSPWNQNVCPPPSTSSTSKVVFNLRVLASVIYEAVRGIEGSLCSLPPISPHYATGGKLPRRRSNVSYFTSLNIEI